MEILNIAFYFAKWVLVWQNIVKLPANISLLIACLKKIAWMSSQHAGQFVSSEKDIFIH